MRLVLLLTAAALTVTACKKKEPEVAAPEPAPKAEMSVKMPREAAAKKLAEKIVANGLERVMVTGTSDFTMDFTMKGDGKWSGVGLAKLGGETLECQETGDWEIAEMNGEKGVIEWTIVRTNCPNRTSGDSQRALVGFEGKEATISFR